MQGLVYLMMRKEQREAEQRLWKKNSTPEKAERSLRKAERRLQKAERRQKNDATIANMLREVSSLRALVRSMSQRPLSQTVGRHGSCRTARSADAVWQ